MNVCVSLLLFDICLAVYLYVSCFKLNLYCLSEKKLPKLTSNKNKKKIEIFMMVKIIDQL